MKLAEARKKQGKTQWHVANATNISQTKISLIENSFVIPDRFDRAAIADALDLEIGEIDWPEEVAA